MLNFEERIGPDLGVTYPTMSIPEWYRDAKLGVFIHWGIYSVPAWAELPSTGHGVEHAYRHHSYAEWYANTVRIPASLAAKRHLSRYGVGTSYEDLADHWQTPDFDADRLIGQLLASGARYVIPTTKHHDGFCLWDTATTAFNATRRGPRRDLIQELHDATRAAGARFGVYFSGAHDWHVADFPPIQSDRELFLSRRNDETFARYCHAQVTELIDRFRPDVLWNDIDWPDGGKGDQDYGVAALWRSYLTRVPAGVVNDRWGVPSHGFLTREYTQVDALLPEVWESTRGLGHSFGYNQAETADHWLTGTDLVQYLVDVVAKNGNVLINVGPRADGTVPEPQLAALHELGGWLGRNGQAIFGTRPWHRPADPGLRYTTDAARLYLHVLSPAAPAQLPPELRHLDSVTWLTGETTAVVADQIQAPTSLAQEPVAVAWVPLIG
ncbi:MAG: alpha-L-fucosidase [Arachnia propionica]|nr:MAG: alpha-L-fucosidase [Arachnia propionica]